MNGKEVPANILQAHGPEVLPVDGHGCDFSKDFLAVVLRAILPVELRAQDEHLEALAGPELRAKPGENARNERKAI